MAKKEINYNAFKMWGSYLGSILYLPLSYADFSNRLFAYPIWPIVRLVENIFPCNARDIICLGPAIITLTVSSLVFGFLIGWGIHSLIRKLRSSN